MTTLESFIQRNCKSKKGILLGAKQRENLFEKCVIVMKSRKHRNVYHYLSSIAALKDESLDFVYVENIPHKLQSVKIAWFKLKEGGFMICAYPTKDTKQFLNTKNTKTAFIDDNIFVWTKQKVEREHSLETLYFFYRYQVSQGYPISMKVTHFLLKLMDELKPKRVLDLGSGWSSFILRLFDAEVWSIDTEKEWLNKTRKFIEEYGHPTGRFVLMDDFDFSEHTYDLVLIDTKPEKERYKMFKKISRCCVGAVVFDDYHNPELRRHAERIFKGWRFVDVRGETGELGKYVGLAYAPEAENV